MQNTKFSPEQNKKLADGIAKYKNYSRLIFVWFLFGGAGFFFGLFEHEAFVLSRSWQAIGRTLMLLIGGGLGFIFYKMITAKGLAALNLKEKIAVIFFFPLLMYVLTSLLFHSTGYLYTKVAGASYESFLPVRLTGKEAAVTYSRRYDLWVGVNAPKRPLECYRLRHPPLDRRVMDNICMASDLNIKLPQLIAVKGKSSFFGKTISEVDIIKGNQKLLSIKNPRKEISEIFTFWELAH